MKGMREMSNDQKSDSVPECIDKSVTSVLKPGAKELGAFLADLIYMKTGDTRLEAAKLRAKHDHEVEIFKRQLADEIDAKPKEYLVEPNSRIVEQALREAQACVSEPALREMFCHLIANAADSRHQSHIHPAFAVMLSQMTPLDAQNLMILSKSSVDTIVNYQYQYFGGGFEIAFENCFLGNPEMSNEEELKLQSESLSALQRQGLIEISYTRWLHNKEVYNKFKATALYRIYEQRIATPPPDGFQSPRDECRIIEVTLQNGLVTLTPLGRAFVNVCMEN